MYEVRKHGFSGVIRKKGSIILCGKCVHELGKCEKYIVR